MIVLDTCPVWIETWRKAAKEHHCSACGSRVAKGERYLEIRYVFDGSADREKACATCASDAEGFGKAHGLSTVGPSSLRELLGECVTDTDDDRWGPMLTRLEARIIAAGGEP